MQITISIFITQRAMPKLQNLCTFQVYFIASTRKLRGSLSVSQAAVPPVASDFSGRGTWGRTAGSRLAYFFQKYASSAHP